MKELTDIIGKLHNVNEKIIEKDNIIFQFNDIINLITQLLTDISFVQSDIYLDMKVKYIKQLEEKLKKIKDTSIIVEPENRIPSATKTNKNTFTRDDICAPIVTNIYEIPKQRGKFQRTPTEKPTNKNEDKIKREYISFNHNNQLYYINTQGTNDEYDIYNETLTIAGLLKGNNITILCDNSPNNTEIITLSSVKTAKTPLFGCYGLN